MRVGVIVPGFPAAQDAWFLPPIAETQAALQAYADVHVFALSYPPHNATHEWRGVPVQSFGAWKKGAWLPAIITALRREHHRRPFNLLHAYWATEPGLVGALAKQSLGVPLLVTSLGGECVGLPRLPYGAQLRWRWRKLVPYILRRADGVICGSTAQSELVKKIAGSANVRPVLLPLGAKLESALPARTKKSSVRLLAVSALLPVKNIGIILEALAQLPSTVTLEIVGDGPLRSNLEAKTRALGLGERVIFRGWISHEALPEIYANADIFVHASWHEGECFVIEEALAAGLPVVSSRVGIAADVVIPGKNGFLFAPDDRQELTAALRNLLEHPEARRQFGDASRAFAVEELDRARQVEKLFQLYQKIAAHDHSF